MTKIEWTEATWNPIVGCSVVSPGCTHCYAMRVAHRLGRNDKTPHYAGLTQVRRGGPVWTDKLALAPEHVLTAPLRRRKPTTWFVNSMSDLFHEDVPQEWIDKVFHLMAITPWHRYQVLTKRADRMRDYLTSPVTQQVYPGLPLPNVWLGVSAEDQTRAAERIPHLLATPAAVRFVSAEPLLGPVNLRALTATRGSIRPYHAILDALDGTCQSLDHATSDWFKTAARLDWVICGGESGPGARPMNPQWARNIRDQCQEAGVAYFHKQNGEWLSVSECEGDYPIHTFLDYRSVRRVGKARAGRLLDGREWNEMPEVDNA